MLRHIVWFTGLRMVCRWFSCRDYRLTYVTDLHAEYVMFIRPRNRTLRHTTLGFYERSVGVHDRSFRSPFILLSTSNTRFKLPIKTSNVRVPEIRSINFVVRLRQSFCIVNTPEFRCCDTAPKSDSEYHQFVVGR